LTSTSFNFFRLNLSISNFGAAHLLTYSQPQVSGHYHSQLP
jgi:hypothetical protein